MTTVDDFLLAYCLDRILDLDIPVVHRQAKALGEFRLDNETDSDRFCCFLIQQLQASPALTASDRIEYGDIR